MKAVIEVGKKRITCSEGLLEALLVGGVVTATALSPVALGALGAVLVANKRYTGNAVSSAIQYHKRRGRIKTLHVGSKVKISLTNEGKKYIRTRFRYRQPRKDDVKKWDKVWRVVIFDLHETKKGVRDMLRFRLKQLGFWQLQRSVWISPYECEKQIKTLQTQFSLSDDEFRLVKTSDIGPDLKIRKQFNIT